MPIEIKDLLPVLGLDGTDPNSLTIDTVKETIGKKFISRDVAHEDTEVNKKAVGRRMGAVTTKISQLFGIPHSQLEGKDVETILSEIQTSHTKAVEELSKKATEGNDKKVTDLMRELEDKNKSLQAYETQNKELRDSLKLEKTESEKKIRTFLLNSKLTEAKSGISFVDDITEVQKTGFDALLNTKYRFDLDDKMEKLVVKDHEGNPIKSKANPGSFADPQEILSLEAEANKLLKKNNAGAGGGGRNVVLPGAGNGEGDKGGAGKKGNPAGNRKRDLVTRQKF